MYIDGWVIPQEVVGRAVRNLENTAKSPRYILEAIIIQKRDASVSLLYWFVECVSRDYSTTSSVTTSASNSGTA